MLLREAGFTMWAAVSSRVTGGRPLAHAPSDAMWGFALWAATNSAAVDTVERTPVNRCPWPYGTAHGGDGESEVPCGGDTSQFSKVNAPV